MKLKWVSSSKSLWFALQILELLEEWKLCRAPCMTGCSSPDNSSFTFRSSCWQDWCFCLDMFYGYRFRIWISVLPWDTYVFQRLLVPPSVSWVHFTEISGRCRAASTVGFSLWLEAFWSLHKENAPICLACLFFSSCEGQSSRTLYTEAPLSSLPAMDQASPAVFPFPQAMSCSALCLGLQLLCFIFPGNGEMGKWEENILLLGLGNPVGCTLREGKRAEVYV